MNCFTKFFTAVLFIFSFLLRIYFSTVFIFFYRLCIVYIFFVVVCCKVWTLGVWGELACHKRLFNPPVLKAGHLVSYLFMCKCVVCLVCVLGWRDGGWRVTSFFSIICFIWLVCYKHTFHGP